jgi:phage gp45-like
MAIAKIATIKHYAGLSTDTKPATAEPGNTFYEVNTGVRFVYNGWAWLPRLSSANQVVNYTQIALNQAAAAYDVMTATAPDLELDAVIVHVPDDLSGEITLTSIAVATDDTVPIEILSAADGAIANLTGNFYKVFAGPDITEAGKKIQLTIAGGASTAGKVADITVLCRPRLPIQAQIGLSTDTKPTDSRTGATFYEVNTGYTFVYNGYAWVPQNIMANGLTVNYKQIALDQAAANYSIMTATAQDLFLDAVIVHVPDDLTGEGTLTSIAIATDDVAPVVILSAGDGAIANLTGNFYKVFQGPAVTVATKILELTIAGGASSGGKVADITVMWRPLVAGGYMLNA